MVTHVFFYTQRHSAAEVLAVYMFIYLHFLTKHIAFRSSLEITIYKSERNGYNFRKIVGDYLNAQLSNQFSLLTLKLYVC